MLIMPTIIKGLLTGLFLQLAVGPVFFYIINLALQKTLLDGFAGVVGVTVVDYFYITLAIVGIGKLLEKENIKKVFGIVSSIVLILFGALIIKGVAGVGEVAATAASSSNLISSFFSVFFLTIISPLTIVLFTSVFAAKVIEHHLTKKQLVLFGLGTGMATFLFMGSSVLVFSLLKGTIPIFLIQIMNLLVGFALIGYGGVRLKNLLTS